MNMLMVKENNGLFLLSEF